MTSSISPLTPADLEDVLAASPQLRPRDTLGPTPAGWVARDDAGGLVGALVDLPGRAGDGPAGAWFASSERTLVDLYAHAAGPWLQAGIRTHRVVLPAGDPLEPALVDLGFGHQQAFGSARLTDLPVPDDRGVPVRAATRGDLPALAELVPLVSHHQGDPPVFAPRTAEFFAQLAESLEEFVDVPSLGALLAREGPEAVGFLLLEHDGPELEIVLAGTAARHRGRGVGHALLAAAAAWGAERGVDRVATDWRTTNPVAARFWRSAGFEVDAYRWARTIDPTPV